MEDDRCSLACPKCNGLVSKTPPYEELVASVATGQIHALQRTFVLNCPSCGTVAAMHARHHSTHQKKDFRQNLNAEDIKILLRELDAEGRKRLKLASEGKLFPEDSELDRWMKILGRQRKP